MATFDTAEDGAALLAQRCDKAHKTPTGWQACCPAHEDTTPSLSITAKGNRILLYCHAGCATTAVVAALGTTMADLRVGAPSAPPPPGRRPAAQAATAPPAGPPRVTATYDYEAADGQLLHQVQRWEPGRKGRDKDFTQRRPDGHGGWIDHMDGVTKVLYNLPAVLRAIAAGELIYLPEGEKDAQNVIKEGLTATTNAGGAAKWEPQYTASLRGAHVVILQDNDGSGRRHTARLTRELHGRAASLRVVVFPELPPKGDVSDWLEAGGTRAQLEARVAATPPPAAPTAPETPATEPLDASPADAEYPYSDAYNAWQLVRAQGHHLRYCAPWKSWLVWTGTHWQRDTTGRVLRWQRQTVKALGAQVADLGDTAAKALLSHLKSSLNTARLKAAVEQAQSWDGLSMDPDILDTDPWLLNCQNGTLDLRTGALRPQRPTDLITKCLRLDYDPAARCPTWERFLWRILGGSQGEESPDRSAAALEARHPADERARRLMTFLQRALGYALTGETGEQCLFVLHGSGANGKSTFLEVLQALLADYAQSTPSASLLAKERQDGIPNDIARLRGARLVTAVEIGEGKPLNEELIKRLTGQDTLTARFLFAEFFDFKAAFKLFIACNHLPTIRGTDHAIWRRVKLVPFAVTIPEPQQDKGLAAKLRAELPGILAWAVRGCLAWQQQGLGEPAEVTMATAGYRQDMDVLGAFLAEGCVLGDYAQVRASVLYAAYKAWCEATGEPALVQRHFGVRLAERGYERFTNNGTWYRGIGIPTPHAL